MLFVINEVASLVTIIVGVFTVSGVGLGLGRWYLKRKEGPESDRVLLHTIDKRLVGEEPTKMNPTPLPGLISEVGSLKTSMTEQNLVMTEHGRRLVKLELGTQEILSAMRPNGGLSDDPGDVLQKILHNQKVLADHIGIVVRQDDMANDEKDSRITDSERPQQP